MFGLIYEVASFIFTMRRIVSSSGSSSSGAAFIALIETLSRMPQFQKIIN